MKLRTRLSLAFLLVAALGVGATLVAAERYLAHAAHKTLEAELQLAAETYGTFATERGARRLAEVRVVAEEPRLKAAVRTVDIDEATLEDVAEELRVAAGADLFVLTDRAGVAVADVSDEELGALEARPEFVSLATKGGGVAVWKLGGQAFEVVVRPLTFGSDVTGYLLSGYRITDTALASVQRQTGSEVALFVDGAPAALAMAEGRRPLAASLADAPAGLSDRRLGDEQLVLHRLRHPLDAPDGVELVLSRSLDEALAGHAVVRRTLAGIGGLTLLVSLGVALVLARGVTRRVERLNEGVAAVGRGDLSIQVAADGEDEVGKLGAAFNQMTQELSRSRESLVRKERLERELQIAQRIQTALLPRSPTAPGYLIRAAMVPAENVGGDLYDVIVAPNGKVWLCIGDVTSHGVTPGLIMMMVQSALSALVSKDPDATPAEVLRHLNRVIYTNVQERLQDDNYLTLTVLRSDGPGRFVYSGAHLDLLVRRNSGEVERLPTPGLWVGILPELDGVEESTVELAVGETLVMYTDGLTEARNAAGEQLELRAVQAAVAESQGAEGIPEKLLGLVRAHMSEQEDDITVVAVERTP